MKVLFLEVLPAHTWKLEEKCFNYCPCNQKHICIVFNSHHEHIYLDKLRGNNITWYYASALVLVDLAISFSWKLT